MTDRSPAETKQDMIAAMGPDLGEYFYLLYQEIAWVHRTWSEYVDLFGTSPQRVDLLNEASGRFAYLLSNMMFDDAMLHVARLTDRPRVAGYDTLTVMRLSTLVDPVLKGSVDAALMVLERRVAFCREWRNNYLAHRNLEVAKGTRASPLPDRTRLAMREALEAFSHLMNEINKHYFKSEMVFRFLGPSGAEELLSVINEGVDARDIRQEQIKKGDFSSIHRPKMRF